VRAESAHEGGARFVVRVPLSTRPPAPVSPPPTAGAATAGTVLLVDDDPAVRTTTRRLLERAGWQVDEASDGAAGLAQFIADPTRYDVVLSDVRMPGLSGPALVRRIRESRPEIPVVLFSGYDRLDGPDDQLPSGVPMLQKPFKPSELVEMVNGAVAQRR
jgi:two-component system cell cycle sensor histidine kinase/response regulator CckA